MKINTFDQLNEIIEALNDVIINNMQERNDKICSLSDSDITSEQTIITDYKRFGREICYCNNATKFAAVWK